MGGVWPTYRGQSLATAIATMQHLGEAEAPQPLYQAHSAGRLSSGSAGGGASGGAVLGGGAGQVRVRCSSQVQPVDVLQEELGRPRRQEVVGSMVVVVGRGRGRRGGGGGRWGLGGRVGRSARQEEKGRLRGGWGQARGARMGRSLGG